MKTREQLKQDYEKELKRLETEERVAAALKGFEPSMIHVHSLYGHVGSIQFGESYSSNPKVSLAQLAQMLEAFPPLPAVHAKGTYTRFLPETWADSAENKERGKETITRIFPVTLDADSVAGYSVKAEWFSGIAGEVWEVSCYLENAWNLVRVESKRIEFHGGFRYDSSRTFAHVNEALNPHEGTWSKCKWGAGSDEWPASFTLYHTQFDDSPAAWVNRTIENLKAKEAQTA